MLKCWLFFSLACLTITDCLLVNNSNHLVVLSHGIMGSGKDLAYLAERLRQNGCLVLISKANAFLNSLHGIHAGASNLVEEISETITESPEYDIQRISFVGNSLGGIYARYAVKLYSEVKPAGIRFYKFMTIATPHMSVAHEEHIYLHQEFGIPVPPFLKKIVAQTMATTGKELFMLDDGALMYTMATDEAFLHPLRLFRERRLYANLKNDFVVPLGTAAFLDKQVVDRLRSEHEKRSGIVAVLLASEAQPRGSSNRSPTPLEKMQASLDSLGWDKHIVHFPGSLPIAHNKIAALRKDPEWFFAKVMGTEEGEYVMDHAAEWLLQ